MNENGQQQPGQELNAPPKLIVALKETSRRGIFVPPYVDNAVLKAAHKHLAGSKVSRRRLLRYLRLWPAIAVSAVVIICINLSLFKMTLSHHELEVGYAREDLNHDGKVDILDSFALARELKSNKRLPATYDVNGDGVVDQRDVLLIATHAVQLNKDNGS